jgi:hypothetical protein
VHFRALGIRKEILATPQPLLSGFLENTGFPVPTHFSLGDQAFFASSLPVVRFEVCIILRLWIE